MNNTKTKNKQKLSISYDRSNQPSIRNFFSATLKNGTTKKNNTTHGGSSNQINVDTHKKNTESKYLSVPHDIATTSDEKTINEPRFVLFDNAKCPSIPSENKDHCEKRKHDRVADEVLNDLLGELENSSPEDYIYSQALVSCKKNTFSNLSSSSKNNCNVKRIKISPSSTRIIKKNIDQDNAVQKHKIIDDNLESNSNVITNYCDAIDSSENTADDLNCDELLKQDDLSSNQNTESSAEQNITDFPDIENLADWFDRDDWNVSKSRNNTLLLNQWTYCKVKTVDDLNHCIVMELEEFSKSITNASSVVTCVLKGCWSDTPVKVDDIISVKAYFDSKNGHWLVDNERGFIIIYPDILITGTGVVGSLFCQRQSVLNFIFPGSDPPNIAMVVGSLVHELLQEVLRKRLYSFNSMERIVDDLVKSRRTLFLAYECNVTLTTITSELNQFLPKIFSFIETYISSVKRDKQKTWSGEILEILSIEENFWIPQLGVKGKTDIILKAKNNDEIKILPLELKTGRASNSSEHRGQIILYSMMMCETGANVDSGLLLYLRENKLMEIKPKHPERSGLIGMRNNLVNYIVANETLNLISETQFELPVLPEPINHHSGCAKCPLLTVCSASLSKADRKNLSSQNPLHKLSVKSLEHLSQSHIRYVFFWLGLLKMEEFERKRNRSFDISDLWHVDDAKREERGYCISKLRLENVQELGSKFLHKMKRASDDDFDFTQTGLLEGDYVVISKGSRYAIAAGYVNLIFEKEIFFKLDRRLEKCDSPTFYVVDKYSMYDSLLGFNTSSLLLLLENSVQAFKLRSLVIDKEIPVFSSSPRIDFEHEEFLKHLNLAQKQAILKTLTTQDYVLIKGMPGTGKTATIVALVKLLRALNHSVLITSHTHSAVDNILLRLKSNINFLRLGSCARVHDLLQQHCEDHLIEKHNFQTVEDLENFYNEKQVVAATCMGCSHVLFRKRQFDYCIVDEATQVLQPSILKSLYSSKRFVLIGDPEQLPPVVQSRKANSLGFGESLFKRLDRPEVTAVLDVQYRMNSQIMQLANSFTYCNALKCANDMISRATVETGNFKLDVKESWLQLALSAEIYHSVVVLNTSSLVAQSISEYSNENEAVITFKMVEKFLEICDTKHDIGIIAPYREQVELLRKTANLKKIQVEINTVDQYQGRDKDIVIYSCTKTSSTGDSGILSDRRRLTVAITRAKRKLIIIGNVDTLKTYSTFKELFSHISKENVINVNLEF